MTLIIRRMKDTDIDKVYAIETSVHISPWSKGILRDCVHVGYDCRVLELNQDIGGYVISRYADNQCHILNLCIANPLQTKGYGRKLLQNLLSSLPYCPDIHSVVLEVRSSNCPALFLYDSMGFKQTEVKSGYYEGDTGIEDAICLKKTLL